MLDLAELPLNREPRDKSKLAKGELVRQLDALLSQYE
jgi:hypothetical protein